MHVIGVLNNPINLVKNLLRTEFFIVYSTFWPLPDDSTWPYLVECNWVFKLWYILVYYFYKLNIRKKKSCSCSHITTYLTKYSTCLVGWLNINVMTWRTRNLGEYDEYYKGNVATWMPLLFEERDIFVHDLFYYC